MRCKHDCNIFHSNCAYFLQSVLLYPAMRWRSSEAAYSCIPAPFPMPQLFPPPLSSLAVRTPLSGIRCSLWNYITCFPFNRPVQTSLSKRTGPVHSLFKTSSRVITAAFMRPGTVKDKTRRVHVWCGNPRCLRGVWTGQLKAWQCGFKDHREDVNYAPSAVLWENQNMCVQSAACIQLEGISMNPDF